MSYGDSEPRKMYKTVCADCGKECEVPFEPKQGRPVYCNECYAKHRPKRSYSGGGGHSSYGHSGGSRSGGYNRGGSRSGGHGGGSRRGGRSRY